MLHPQNTALQFAASQLSNPLFRTFPSATVHSSNHLPNTASTASSISQFHAVCALWIHIACVRCCLNSSSFTDPSNPWMIIRALFGKVHLGTAQSFNEAVSSTPSRLRFAKCSTHFWASFFSLNNNRCLRGDVRTFMRSMCDGVKPILATSFWIFRIHYAILCAREPLEIAAAT